MPEDLSITTGELAPDFALQNEEGETVRLSDMRGRPVVLVFYPFDWSYICTGELCDLRDKASDWMATGAVVYGISRDSIYSHKAWKSHLGLNYTLLADLVGDVATLYGAWNNAGHHATRTTIVVDPGGTIRYIVRNGGGDARDHAEMIQAVRAMAAPVQG